MNDKRPIQDNREKIDNNKHMKELFKGNKDHLEIAKEITSNQKIADVVGERLAKHRRFPTC